MNRLFQRRPVSMAKIVVASYAFLLAWGHAQATTELVLQLDTSWRYDSNPLRFTDDANVVAAIGRGSKGDSIVATDARGAVIVPLDSPQTRLMLTGQLGRRKFDQLTQLDNTEYAYRAALEWRLGQLWQGELSHRDESQLFNYFNGGLTTREMVRSTTDTGEIALRATPSIEFPLMVRSRRVNYETSAYTGYDSDERTIDLSAKYQATTLSNVRGGVRRTNLRYTHRDAAQIASQDSGFTDTELYVEGDWHYSMKTRFTGRIAAQQRIYDNLTQKNFALLNTDLRLFYNYSPLTRLSLEVWNRPFGLTDPLALYVMTTGGQVGVRWQSTPKTRVNMLFTKEIQNYQYAVLGIDQTNPRFDRTRVGGSLVYAWAPSVRVYVEGFRERLERGNFGSNINQTLIRAGLEYTFENLTGLAQRTGLGERR